MKRIIFLNLLDWRDSTRRMPLLLRGARQVGKTHIVRELGKTFDHCVEINFEKNPELIKIFDQDLDPLRITRDISLTLNKVISPGKTLLFLDEIQEAPKAIIALRYFYEEMPELHVIAAGSLVDFAIEQVGVPVGRISFLYMYPMSFIEYLCALGFHQLAWEIINHDSNKAINDAIHNKILRLLGEYMVIGGMPSAVNHWVSQKDLESCLNILKNIKNAYEQDFVKYAKKHEVKYVELLFKQIPRFICQHFKYSNISDHFRKRELEPALFLLEKAGIVHRVIRSYGNGVPLGAEADQSKFKLLPLDIGLNQVMLGLELKEWLTDPISTFSNKGNLSESFVGQELLAYSNSTDKQQLYYWHRENKGSQAETDYLITKNQHDIIPIEVKSAHGAGLQSMRMFLQSHKDFSPYGIRFSVHNYSNFDHIHSYPLYAVGGIVEEKERLLNFIRSDLKSVIAK